MSEVLGLSFEGLEHITWELFAELEKKAVVRQVRECTEGSKNSGKIPRELRNLSWGLSYAKGEGSRREETGRKVRGFRTVNS